MHDIDDTAVERRLRAVLEERLAALPLGLTVGDVERRREARDTARRSVRNRGITLLAAAALIGGGALAAGSGILRLPSVVPPAPSPSFVAVATAPPDAPSPSASAPAAPSASPISSAGSGGTWIPTGSMGSSRSDPTAVRLQDGRVLVIGGRSGEVGYQDDLKSAELYDPATGTWSATGSISKPLAGAALLRDGKVLALVGYEGDGPSAAEVYDPSTGNWDATGPLAKGGETLRGPWTVLKDGRVLVTGWEGSQVYDPTSDHWTATGPMVREPGPSDTHTVLQDGRVLVVGGAGAQVYDPATGEWSATSKKIDQGFGSAAVLLPDGRVLVAGGTGFKPPDDYFDQDSATIYDPATGSWRAIANLHTKMAPMAALMQPDGKVLVVGSTDAEVYDLATGVWTPLRLPSGVGFLTAMPMPDGSVLAIGGVSDPDHPACPPARYDPYTGSWTIGSTMLRCATGRSFTVLLDGTVLAAGGDACTADQQCGSHDEAELYVPAGAQPPFGSFATPPPFVPPSPTPVAPMLAPATGPVPPNARSWTITVVNDSSEPATLFVAESGELRLVGSATPNVVPPGETVEVTFLFPAKDGPHEGWITVNPHVGDGADPDFIGADDIGMPGKIVVGADGDWGWVSP